MPVGVEDRAHADRLIAAHKKRLHPLEVQAAQEGKNVDPAITNEIADIRIAIAELESHEPPSEIITQARRVVRQQYETDDDFQAADQDARSRRQIITAIELHAVKQDVLAIKEDLLGVQYHVAQNAFAARVWATRNFWMSTIAILLALALVWALLSHMRWI